MTPMPPTVFCNRCGFASIDDANFCQRCGATILDRSKVVAALQLPDMMPHYAGFWIRVVSSLLDTVVLVGALIPIRMLFGSAVTVIGVNAGFPIHKVMVTRRVVRIVLGFFLGWIYKAGMESSTYQGTLGKLVTHLKVTDTQEKRLTLGRASARYFSKYLSTLVLFMGYVMVAFDEKKRGLHDRIAGTFVVYRPKRPDITTNDNAHPVAPSAR